MRESRILVLASGSRIRKGSPQTLNIQSRWTLGFEDAQPSENEAHEEGAHLSSHDDRLVAFCQARPRLQPLIASLAFANIGSPSTAKTEELVSFDVVSFDIERLRCVGGKLGRGRGWAWAWHGLTSV